MIERQALWCKIRPGILNVQERGKRCRARWVVVQYLPLSGRNNSYNSLRERGSRSDPRIHETCSYITKLQDLH